MYGVSEVGVSGAERTAVIYLRVSSAGQVNKDFDPEGYSIPVQRIGTTRYAEGMGSVVVKEFVDYAESARTADRPKLQEMLRFIESHRIDYVIFYDVSRLARNELDAFQLLDRIEQAGGKLWSATENFDVDTPEGRLMFAMLASTQAFRSRGDAKKVRAGMLRKVETGGTPNRARLGYLNTREHVQGREVRTIGLDPVRAPLITELFRLYATGDYSLSELEPIMEVRGLRSRPRRWGDPEKPLRVNDLQRVLRDRYYIGQVVYQGKTYGGRHEPLVDLVTFEKVQEVLDAKRKSGERSWKHQNFLRGTLYCGACKRRLFYTRVRGRNGRYYEYYVCSGKEAGCCTEPHHRTAAVEDALERYYARVVLSAAEQQGVREQLHAYAAEIEAVAAREVAEARDVQVRLDRQERKLLEAHYAERIGAELFEEETTRISRERAAALATIQSFEAPYQQALRQLDVALGLLDDVQRAYLYARDQGKRLMNQAIFERVWICRESVVEAELQEPFGDILALGRGSEVASAMPSPGSESKTAGLGAWGLEVENGPENEKNSAELSFRGVSHVLRMVRQRGLEPPRGYPPQGPQPCASTNSATGAGRCSLDGSPSA